MPKPHQAVIDFFKKEGPLSQLFNHYEERVGQVQMAEAVGNCLINNQHLAIEAGTGTGKSFAYLIPALLLRKKNIPIVVSTGTIALQEQLIEKDIPELSKCLDRPIKAALAKGRSNYICEHRFAKHINQLDKIADNERDIETLNNMKTLMGRSIFSRSNLPGPLSEIAWSQICSESGVCGHGKCKEHPCSFTKARNLVREADVIVVNHSLLFVHLQLMQADISLLPRFEQLILDEAHHCPDTASEQFGVHLSNTSLKFFLDKLFNRQKKKGFLSTVKPTPMVLVNLVDKIRDQAYQFFESLAYWREQEASDNGRVYERLNLSTEVIASMKELSDMLGNWAGSSDTQDEEREFRYYSEQARGFHNDMEVFTDMSMKDAAYWIETSQLNQNQRITARIAYIDISSRIKELTTNSLNSVIMTSATLSTGKNNFTYFKKRMGIEEDIPTLIVKSPFTYQQQVALLTSKRLEAPTDEKWQGNILTRIEKCIHMTHGGAFVLVTSYDLLKRLYEHLKKSTDYPICAQGITGQRHVMINAFKSSPHSVLIGNQTFWEGIDIPGKSLRNVIIPRLPFEVPSHPLQEARYDDLQKKGRDPFIEIALPHAVMRLKQGFGRLIRREDDTGLVCILDSRLHNKRYGKDFLGALPDCQHFIDKMPATDFLNNLRA